MPERSPRDETPARHADVEIGDRTSCRSELPAGERRRAATAEAEKRSTTRAKRPDNEEEK